MTTPTNDHRAMTHVYVIDAPSHELHGEEVPFYSQSREVADDRAMTHARMLRVPAALRHVGTRDCGHFTPSVPYEALPGWARQWVDEQRERVAKARGRAKTLRGAA